MMSTRRSLESLTGHPPQIDDPRWGRPEGMFLYSFLNVIVSSVVTLNNTEMVIGYMKEEIQIGESQIKCHHGWP